MSPSSGHEAEAALEVVQYCTTFHFSLEIL